MLLCDKDLLADLCYYVNPESSRKTCKYKHSSYRDSNDFVVDLLALFQHYSFTVKQMHLNTTQAKLESEGQELPATFCLQLVEYPVTLTAQVDTEITAQIISE
ncbi:hypothetical protein T06_3231 [Trichinella sp. T6]|nr:hypothetical protein T06_3231 [Trichinella sp. T6]